VGFSRAALLLPLSGQRVPSCSARAVIDLGCALLYFRGPDSMVFEYSVGVDEIEDEDTHRSRQFGFRTVEPMLWGSKSGRPR